MMDNIEFKKALFWICHLNKLYFTIARKVIVISKRKDIKSEWEQKEEEREYKGEKETEWYKKIKENLNKKISLNFHEKGLREFALFFNKTLGVIIVIDYAFLYNKTQHREEKTITTKEGKVIKKYRWTYEKNIKVTLKADDIKGNKALDKIVEQIPGATWKIQDRVIFITKKKE